MSEEQAANAAATEDRLEGLVKYVPDTVANKKEYLKLVSDQILGRDAQGQLRPTVDLVYFLQVCQSTGLNPVSKQIYGIYRGNKLTIQAGIDGLRAVAERTGLYAGSDAGQFDYKDNKLEKATVTVYKLNKITGERMPTSATALWSEYSPAPGTYGNMWTKMPETMLEKCAEAKALRKAFPNCAQVYAEEEMHQAERIVPKVRTEEENKALKAKTEEILEEVKGGSDANNG